MTDSLKDEVVEVVSGVLEVPAGALDDEPALSSFEQFDSLRQLNLLLALEEYFQIELSPEDVTRLGSVAEIRELVVTRR